MFKLCLALAFGLVAAFAIGLAGLLADVTLATAFLRSLLGFLLAGLLSYLVAFVLEAKEWADFDKNLLADLTELRRALADLADMEKLCLRNIL